MKSVEESFFDGEDCLSALIKEVPPYEVPDTLTDWLKDTAQTTEKDHVAPAAADRFDPPERLRDAVLREARLIERAQTVRRHAVWSAITRQENMLDILGAPVSEATKAWLQWQARRREALRYEMSAFRGNPPKPGEDRGRRMALVFALVLAFGAGLAVHRFWLAPHSDEWTAAWQAQQIAANQAAEGEIEAIEVADSRGDLPGRSALRAELLAREHARENQTPNSTPPLMVAAVNQNNQQNIKEPLATSVTPTPVAPAAKDEATLVAVTSPASAQKTSQNQASAPASASVQSPAPVPEEKPARARAMPTIVINDLPEHPVTAETPEAVARLQREMEAFQQREREARRLRELQALKLKIASAANEKKEAGQEEPPKVAAEAQPAKGKAEKSETQPAVARAEADKPTPKKVEAKKPDTEKPAAEKPAIARIEVSKAEPAKVATAKVEPAKAEPVKVAAAKVEAAKAEPVKVAAAKVEAVKPEPVKPEPVAKTAPKRPTRAQLEDDHNIIVAQAPIIASDGITVNQVFYNEPMIKVAQVPEEVVRTLASVDLSKAPKTPIKRTPGKEEAAPSGEKVIFDASRGGRNLEKAAPQTPVATPTPAPATPQQQVAAAPAPAPKPLPVRQPSPESQAAFAKLKPVMSPSAAKSQSLQPSPIVRKTQPKAETVLASANPSPPHASTTSSKAAARSLDKKLATAGAYAYPIRGTQWAQVTTSLEVKASEAEKKKNGEVSLQRTWQVFVNNPGTSNARALQERLASVLPGGARVTLQAAPEIPEGYARLLLISE